jgi:hypothetical protein
MSMSRLLESGAAIPKDVFVTQSNTEPATVHRDAYFIVYFSFGGRVIAGWEPIENEHGKNP